MAKNVDPVTQGSLLAPSPASISTGAVEILEGAFYETPKQPVATGEVVSSYTPEQLILLNEAEALGYLEKAHRTRLNRTANMLPVDRIHKAKGDHSRESHRIKTAVESSWERITFLESQAKAAFGRSVGIASTSASGEVAQLDKSEHIEWRRDAVRPEQQAELDEGFAQFKSRYGGANNKEARHDRQKELETALAVETAIIEEL